MAGKQVLVIEDDSTLLDVLKYNLKKEGYEVITAADGVEGLELARRKKPDLIILDLMLPSLDGLEICRILRKDMIVPILMLTARVEEIDIILGLEMGADDYMTKPFSMRELLARVRAMLRRAEMQEQDAAKGETPGTQIIQAGDLEIDIARHVVKNRGLPVELNPKEFDLLVFLARNPEQVFNRDTLLTRIWGYDYTGDTRTVDVHIRWLRQKIEDNPEMPRHLITVRGVGYKFEA